MELSRLIISVILPIGVCGAPARTFYLAINEVYWNYYPNTKTGQSLYSEGSPEEGLFKKAMYQEYTDDTFTTLKTRPAWMGYLGPTLYAERDESVAVILFNNASRKYSLHPHGVLYIKQFEGAPYNDGVHMNKTAGLKDVVYPGETFKYVFKAVEEASPDEDDPDCLTWMYHSHIDTVRDISSGLVGMLLTCKKGVVAATKDETRYTLYVNMVDETKSWYVEHNRLDLETDEAVDEDDVFERMRFSVINGFTFGQLPGLETCVGQKVTWHLAGFGTSSDIHSISISGHVFEYFNRRKHNINVNAAQFATATTTSHNKGRWLLYCDNNDHDLNGMYAYIHASKCPNILYPSQHIGRVLFHYIAAEEVTWNYAPTGSSGVDGEALTEPGRKSNKYFKQDGSTIGGTFKKVVFRAYEDYDFKTKKAHPEDMGLLGPVIRAEVNDQVQVVFKNMASRPYSVHAEGVMFSKNNEGMPYPDDVSQNRGSAVAPGETYTYFWHIPEDMGPQESDPQCLTHVYTSGVDRVKDVQSGLIGPLLICQPDVLDPTREKQTNVDREFVLLLSVFDEGKSWYLEENMKTAGINLIRRHDLVFLSSLQMHSMNGLMYANLQGLDMCVGDSVAWHVFTVGSTDDMHSLYFHGSTFSQVHTHHNTIGLLPGDRKTLYMNPDVAGVWKLGCAVNSHPGEGEVTLYNVTDCSPKESSPSASKTGKKRTFYIQAEEVEWDYAPSGLDLIYNKPLPSDMKYTKYTKILYRGYTDKKFTTPVDRTGQEYMGLLGPLIRTEVGDTLVIVFRNKGPQPFSIHPTGLVYNRSNYRFDQPRVRPGETFKYVWKIRKSEGPGPEDPNCINSPYHSDVDVNRDINSGLVGTLVICRPGVLDDDGLRTDIDRDLSVYYSIIDESTSWMAEENAQTMQEQTGHHLVAEDLPIFIAINGYVFGNQPLPTMVQWEHVDWYLMTLGNDKDLHPVHFHGNDVVVYDGNRHVGDVNQLWPGVYSTVSMYCINPGLWLYHCHVNFHITSGMEAMYQVHKAPKRTSEGGN